MMSLLTAEKAPVLCKSLQVDYSLLAINVQLYSIQNLLDVSVSTGVSDFQLFLNNFGTLLTPSKD